jgi:hypothetical protein
MKTILVAATFVAMLVPVAEAQPSKETLRTEVLISSLPAEDLTKWIAGGDVSIVHFSEIARGRPVAVVVRATGCMKDATGRCNVNADVVVYRPDGSVFHEAKTVDLGPSGRIVVPLKIDANAATGLHRAAVRVRDMTARHFAEMEVQFAIK